MRPQGASLTLGSLLLGIGTLVVWLGASTGSLECGPPVGTNRDNQPPAATFRGRFAPVCPAHQALAVEHIEPIAAPIVVGDVDDRAAVQDGDITGRILDGAGLPVADACVQLELPATEGRVSRRVVQWSNASGHFAFPKVPAGQVHLRASAPGFRLSPLAAFSAADRAPRVLRLQRDTGLCGQLLSASGDPAGGPVVIRSLGQQAVRATTIADHQGRFCLGDLEPGSYEVTAAAGTRQRIDLARGSQAEMTLVLDPPLRGVQTWATDTELFMQEIHVR